MINEWLFAIGVGLAPSLIWLLFYLREDKLHPEPIRLIAYTFILGALGTFLVLALQMITHSYLTRMGVGRYDALAIGTFAGIEEIVKFLIILIFVSRRPEFDEPVDAMIYMLTAALGFAAVENIASFFRGADALGSLVNTNSMQVLILRFLGATLVHSLSSATIGYYWGRALRRSHFVAGRILIGLCFAVAIHGVFNYLVIFQGLGAWAMGFVILMGFFVLIDFERLKLWGQQPGR